MTDQRNFRTEIPNIIDDLGLDPHERALYVHYKRTCGGSENCEWTESVRVTAKKTKMSHTRVSQARASLVGRGLIEIDSRGNDGTAVKIVNVWSLNNTYYAYKNGRPDIDGWTVGQLKDWCEGVNIIYTSEEKGTEESPGVNNMNTSVNNAYTGVNIIYNKKEPIKNQPEESKREAPPVKKEKPKNKDSPPRPPAVDVFRDVAHRFPDKAIWALIQETVGEGESDLQFWRQVITGWIACGWNKLNVAGMLDFYRRRQIPTTRNGVKRDEKHRRDSKQAQPKAQRRKQYDKRADIEAAFGDSVARPGPDSPPPAERGD